MSICKFTPLPPKRPDPKDPKWLDRIAFCTISCAKTLESRQIRTNEIPVVLGGLIVALSDHSGQPVETIAAIVTQAAVDLRDNQPPEPAAA